jgi:hypothetical protein
MTCPGSVPDQGPDVEVDRLLAAQGYRTAGQPEFERVAAK